MTNLTHHQVLRTYPVLESGSICNYYSVHSVSTEINIRELRYTHAFQMYLQLLAGVHIPGIKTLESHFMTMTRIKSYTWFSLPQEVAQLNCVFSTFKEVRKYEHSARIMTY